MFESLFLLKPPPQMPGSFQKAILVVSCLFLRNDDSVAFIYANWSKTCWSTVEHWETAQGLVTEGCIVVSDCMLISIISVSVERLEMSCAEEGDALAPQPLVSEVCLQEIKFILNPVLFCHSLESLVNFLKRVL